MQFLRYIDFNHKDIDFVTASLLINSTVWQIKILNSLLSVYSNAPQYFLIFLNIFLTFYTYIQFIPIEIFFTPLLTLPTASYTMG
jgi:hypothetical protein